MNGKRVYNPFAINNFQEGIPLKKISMEVVEIVNGKRVYRFVDPFAVIKPIKLLKAKRSRDL